MRGGWALERAFLSDSHPPNPVYCSTLIGSQHRSPLRQTQAGRYARAMLMTVLKVAAVVVAWIVGLILLALVRGGGRR